MNALTWMGIAFRLSQSAMFSGLNVVVFSVGRLRLEVDPSTPPFIWGNGCAKVLLTLLAVAACHRPIVCNPSTPMGEVMGQLKVRPQSPDDDVVGKDLILLWSGERRIITGSDMLGRLLCGITRREPVHSPSKPEPESRHA